MEWKHIGSPIIKGLPLLAVLLSSCIVNMPPDDDVVDDYNVVDDYYYADADTRDVCLDWLPTALWETELLEVDAAVDWSSMIVHMHMGDAEGRFHCFMRLGNSSYRLTIAVPEDIVQGFVVEYSGPGDFRSFNFGESE